MRAFLAIPVQEPAAADLLAVRARLLADVPAVRWAPAETAHITLHFFGTIAAEEQARALDVLRRPLAEQRPLTLHLVGLGAFPQRGEPRVLWCGVGGDTEGLTACALACRDALRAAGFAVEGRPFRAHCTLGRPRSPWPADARDRWRRHLASAPQTAPFTADRAVLYESLTDRGGARHIPRNVLMFGDAHHPTRVDC